MSLRINKIHFPITVLGPGQRIGIWFQGCGIACPGCCSQDTWSTQGGGSLDVAALLRWCEQVSHVGFDGVTLSGGEPFDQADGLLTLLRALRDWRSRAHLSFDVLVYTGYMRRAIERKYPEHLGYVDVLASGPYRERIPTQNALVGSGNQELLYVNARVRPKYEQWLAAKSRKSVQLAVDEHGVWLVGIPSQGDLVRLEKKCQESGLALSGLSWHC